VTPDASADTPTVTGPHWSAPGLDIAAGRFPLAVERHVLRMVDRLVPGVTTVTPHARYFALHGLIADEVAEAGLDVPAARDLLRRAEVVMAGASFMHDHGDIGLARAHGLDRLTGRLTGGTLDLAVDSQAGPGGYVSNSWGFWAPYIGSELTLEVIAGTKLPEPGAHLDSAAVRGGFEHLLDLARQDTLEVQSLTSAPHLCVCAGATQADGPWLASLLYPTGKAEGPAWRDRRHTIDLLTRLIDLLDVKSITDDLVPHVAFGDLLADDEELAVNPLAPAWRGLVLRNYSVGAWRRLWSWLVEQVDEGLTPAAHVADALAEALPDVTVKEFLAELPKTRLASGRPAPVEQQLRDGADPLPLRELRILAVNAQRVGELPDAERVAFLGEFRNADLAPEWTAARFADNRTRPLRQFARELTVDLLARAQRVALSKARRRPNGTIWLPTRLHERGDMLFKTSSEGRGDVGVRLPQLTSVLAGAGVVAYSPTDGWSITDPGRDRLAG
jgi:hypothetical protein